MMLSILIPSRNEMFLSRTIEDILRNIRGDTEIIAILDGEWAEPPIDDHKRVTLIYHSKSIGQRAATNEAAKLSRARFIMKCDAHCSFGKGFDVRLAKQFEYNWTIVPRMYNLHVFDWLCQGCGNRVYQGPKPEKCEKCESTNIEMDVVWQRRKNRMSDFYRFDSDLHFQYWSAYKHRAIWDGDLVETMSLLGACWMMERSRYWELGGLDESHGSWGQMGTEIACKTWLSGGKLLTNKSTWFAHLFRTQKGFGFPYPNEGNKRAVQRSIELWKQGNWPLAKYPLSWLIDKFSPIPGWAPGQEVSSPIIQIPPQVLQPQPPPLPKRLFNFGKAAISHFLNGSPTCTQEQIDERLKICLGCELFKRYTEDPPTGVCSHNNCGCNIKSLQGYLNKLAWSDQQCPIGKWGKIDNSS